MSYQSLKRQGQERKLCEFPDGLMPRLLDCVTGDSVAITADQATVAQWRQARTEASYRDDMWSLQVFKAATVFLEEAERYGLADDDVLLQRLAEKGHATALRLVSEVGRK